MRVLDLPESDRTSRDITLRDGTKATVTGHPVFLFCEWCHEEYSATRGDYFMLAPDQEIECCGHPMILARRESRIVPVEGGE